MPVKVIYAEADGRRRTVPHANRRYNANIALANAKADIGLVRRTA
jgi:hypothetical protein